MEHLPEERPRNLSPKRLQSGPPLPGHHVQYDEVRHAWVIDQVLLLCSVPEYRCLKRLLEGVDRCVPYAQFVACLQETTGADARQERMRLAHIMSTLRPQLWPLGLDIGSIMNIGYILLSGEQEGSALPSPPDASCQKHPPEDEREEPVRVQER